MYQAEVKSQGSSKAYVGVTSTSFKTRYNNHKNSFNDRSKRYSTELSKHVWDLKDSDKEYSITWSTVCKARPYSNKSKRCNLCLCEKYTILCNPVIASLNKRSELLSKCRHQDSCLIGKVT